MLAQGIPIPVPVPPVPQVIVAGLIAAGLVILLYAFITLVGDLWDWFSEGPPPPPPIPPPCTNLRLDSVDGAAGTAIYDLGNGLGIAVPLGQFPNALGQVEVPAAIHIPQPT